MQVNLSLNSGAMMRAFAEFLTKVAPIADADNARADRMFNEAYSEPQAPAADPTQTELPLPAAEAPAKKERKPRAKKEAPEAPALNETPAEKVIDAEPIAQDAPKQPEVVVQAEPAPAPAAPAADLSEKLANATRALAKTNFEAAKKLLEQFGVKRFGELPKERYAEYEKAIAAL